ncbi:MAG: hypothetical protein K8S87_06820 [Planctomycetes bacterium]|nr:hypothetical protein [Planctomycetota bacterium]
MNNKDEIETTVDDEISANNELRGVDDSADNNQDANTGSKDLHMRFIVPVAFSAFLLLFFLIGLGKAPEILVDFERSLELTPKWYVLSPENADRSINIIKNYPAEIPMIESLPTINGYNLLGSKVVRILIEDRVDDIIYSLIYVSQTDKSRHIVLHLLSAKGDVVDEMEIYSAKRMTEGLRIYRIDEVLISTFQIDGNAMVLVQAGTDLDDASELYDNILLNNR